MYKTTVLDWPKVIVHLAPGVGTYRTACFVCGHQWVEVEKAGKVRDVECPMCSCKTLDVEFPMPERARGHDGVWIDPGTEPSTLYLN